MATNRRNYYRLLHVQPDAPADVVKAAYRTLIRVHHPDAGGDHQMAALLNEAYEVLSDATRRSAYDVKRAVRPIRSAGAAAGGAGNAQGDAARRGCAFCRLALPMIINANTRCLRCESPLAPLRRDPRRTQSAERRGLPRVSKSDWGVLRTSWPGEPLDVRMRDLSLDGISVYCGTELPVGIGVRIVSQAADVVADVLSCRRFDKIFTVHARLVTAIFSARMGGFVSTVA